MAKPIADDSLPTVDALADYLGESVHTALRKVGDSKESNSAWLAINAMDNAEWSGIVGFVAYYLRDYLKQGVL